MVSLTEFWRIFDRLLSHGPIGLVFGRASICGNEGCNIATNQAISPFNLVTSGVCYSLGPAPRISASGIAQSVKCDLNQSYLTQYTSPRAACALRTQDGDLHWKVFPYWWSISYLSCLVPLLFRHSLTTKFMHLRSPVRLSMRAQTMIGGRMWGPELQL